MFGKVNVVSNGTLLNEEYIDEMIKSKIVLFSVSLDGWGKTHDLNRNKEGIFDKITNNLEIINKKRHKSPTMIDIKTIVLKITLKIFINFMNTAQKWVLNISLFLFKKQRA